MPIYEYECSSCMNVVEVWQSVADEPMTTCPACSGNLKKIISMSSFHLKGNGWYADGYSSAADGGKQAKACGTSACGAVEAAKSTCSASPDCGGAKTGADASTQKKTDSSPTVASATCGC